MRTISKTSNEDEGILAVYWADLVGDRAWPIWVHSDWEGGVERHFCNDDWKFPLVNVQHDAFITRLRLKVSKDTADKRKTSF